MEKGRYKYFPVVQNPEKARFNRSFVFVNNRDWTGPDGVFHPAACRSIGPGNSGIYVVDTESEYGTEKLATLTAAVKEGIHPILGPFDNIEEAVMEERKARPLSVAEKLAQADGYKEEAAKLRRELNELKAKGTNRG
jgi:hypothetical protein